MTIGVGVEGPSDREFWNKVLHKHFPKTKFDIRNMKNRDNLIRETPRLLDAFRSLRYNAAFIIVDRDDTPCPAAVIDEFDETVRQEARKPSSERYLFICVAIRELEAWLLADGNAINAVLPKASYALPKETGDIGAERLLKKLWREQHGQIAFNKINFARSLAPKFKPERASKHSASFKYFWNRIDSKA
jgi:hypothetical protein